MKIYIFFSKLVTSMLVLYCASALKVKELIYFEKMTPKCKAISEIKKNNTLKLKLTTIQRHCT